MAGEAIPVSGGLMHRMYKVKTTEGIYAVKQLNPEIMKRPQAKLKFGLAEALEKKPERKGIPIVPALVFDGEKMVELDGYLKAYDNGFRSYNKLYGIAHTRIEWLEYNIRRALGVESTDEQEIKLGREEVRNTIGRIRYLNSIENEVIKILNKLVADK